MGAEMTKINPSDEVQTNQFKAETQKLLNILIHSLYTDQEVFLRELISNASDALTRLNFEMLTKRDVLDPEADLAIWIKCDEEKNTITIRDSGIGLNAEEASANLGTIAHSGVRAFLDAAEHEKDNISELIGQFGVGFYSAFMVAESIQVQSRSYRPEENAILWTSSGMETYTIEPGEKPDRGTEISIQLKEEAADFCKEYRLREIIRKHSDYIPFPIYIGESQEQINQQTALWRQQPRDIEDNQYKEFYRQLTLDVEEPITQLHLAIDAPVQFYATLFVPSSPERNAFSLRKQDGLKLYARKVLIQEYCQDLLPGYFRFFQGVVDSEDLPLNVSRESVQSSQLMSQLKKLITSKIIDHLEKFSIDNPETYFRFWETYGQFIKEGIATGMENAEALYPLLRFHSTSDIKDWLSLDGYVESMIDGQDKIYFIMGDDAGSIMNSPHLEIFKNQGINTLLLTESMDPFMLIRLNKYKEYALVNVSRAEPELDSSQETKDNDLDDAADVEAISNDLVTRFRKQLGEKVADVRASRRLVESPARLVDQDDAIPQELQKAYHLFDKEFETPQKILEVNLQHPLLMELGKTEEAHPISGLIIDQIYEDALLIEGLHPDPASMIQRIQQLMEAAITTNQ
jgi:molecular chaperone HtpG